MIVVGRDMCCAMCNHDVLGSRLAWRVIHRRMGGEGGGYSKPGVGMSGALTTHESTFTTLKCFNTTANLWKVIMDWITAQRNIGMGKASR